jgi:nucleoid-associated protein YgaU
MDQLKNLNLKAGTLILGLSLISACSSSKVDSSSETPETVASGEISTDAALAPPPLEASTDAVPPSPEAEPPSPEVAAADPSAAPADLNAGTGVTENPALTQPAAPEALDASANPPPPPAMDVPPAPVGSEVASAPVSGEMSSYKVKRGDTLMKIAFQKYGDLYRWKEILDANPGKMTSANDLAPGQVLNLPGSDGVTIEQNGERYLIKKGDTLGLISNDVYGTKAKWKKLWENNRQLIKNPNKIYAGFNLYYVPEARLTTDQPEGGPSAANQSLPFKKNVESQEVAKGAPAPSEAPREPASAK